MSILNRVVSTRGHEHAYFNMLVYGAPGTGKTWLARTAVESGHRVLLLDADRGTMTLREADVPTLPITSYDDLMQVYQELRTPGHAYDTIFVDNLSEIQKMLVDRLKFEHGKKFGRQSWGTIVERTSELVRRFRMLPMNLVMLAHSMEVEDEERVRVRPALHGKKLPHEIGGLFDLVGYAHTAPDGDRGVSYRLGFATVGDRHITKDRSGKLDAVEPNDFGLLYRKVFGHGPRHLGAPAPWSASAEGAPSWGHAAPPVPLVVDPTGVRVTVAEPAAWGAVVAHAPSPHQPAPMVAPPYATPPQPVAAPQLQAPSPAPAAPWGVAAPQPPSPALPAPALAPPPPQPPPQPVLPAPLPALNPLAAPAPAPQPQPLPAPQPAPAAAAARPPRALVPLSPALAAPRVVAPPAEPVAIEEPELALGPPPTQGADTSGEHGSAAWGEASRRLRDALARVAGGDKERAEQLVALIRREERVKSSTELSAGRLSAWAAWLEDAHGRGALGPLSHALDRAVTSSAGQTHRLHEAILRLHGELARAGRQAEATRVIKEASHGRDLYELDAYVLSRVHGQLRRLLGDSAGQGAQVG